ncbi:MAG: hypothetical protein HY429_02305 [Candidatus Levybacteria bacterium]|nr:hypothetical protein [Candidatus Levybacteria bacterium]
MESSPTELQSQQQVFVTPQNRKLLPTKFVAIIFAVILVLIAYTLFWAQFFSNPNSSKKQQFVAKPTPSASAPAKITLPCPSVAEFCTQGQRVTDGINNGIGSKLDTDASVRAVFDGKIIYRTATLSPQEGGETLTKLTLVRWDNKMSAIYYIKGSVVLKKEYKTGNEILKIPSKTMTYFNNNSLAFFLFDENKKEIPLNSINFIY